MVFSRLSTRTASCRLLDSSRPEGSSTLARRKAVSTSPTVRPRAASASLSSQTRMARRRAPLTVTSPTPDTVVSRSTTTRSARSVRSSPDRRSLVRETRITGWLSLSALSTRGSSASSGKRLANEPTASRTSAAALSMSRPAVKVIRV